MVESPGLSFYIGILLAKQCRGFCARMTKDTVCVTRNKQLLINNGYSRVERLYKFDVRTALDFFGCRLNSKDVE